MLIFRKKVIDIIFGCLLLQYTFCYHFTIDKFNPDGLRPLSTDVTSGAFLYLHRYESWKYWSDFKLGFPDVSIGFIFPSFKLLVTRCSCDYDIERNSHYHTKSCYYQFATNHCGRFHPSQYPNYTREPHKILNLVDDKHCVNLFRMVCHNRYSVFFTTPYRDALKLEWRHSVFKNPDGTLDEINLKYIQSVFKSCIDNAKLWCKVMRVPKHMCPAPYRFCGFGQFAEMFLRAEIHRSKHR